MKISYPVSSVILSMAIASYANAGIQTELYKGVANNGCVVDMRHDATPESETGTIILKTYLVDNGLHHSCDVAVKELIDGLAYTYQYLEKLNLKPVTSIFIGRLCEYGWIKDYLSAWSKRVHETDAKIPREQFQDTLIREGVFVSFEKVSESNGFVLTGIECEKVMYYETGVPQDAMCWLKINKTKQTDP